MSGRRILDGDVRQDPEFAKLSYLAQLTWDRLWQICDSWGRGRWRADALAFNCFPVDDKVSVKKMRGVMKELEPAAEGLATYEVKKERFFQLLDWEKVFTGRYRTQSWVPKPPESIIRQMNLREGRQSTSNSTEKAQKVKVKVKDKVIGGAESTPGQKPVDKKTKMTKEEIWQMAEEHRDDSWEDIRHLPQPVQEAIKQLAKKMTMPGAENTRREKLTDEQICERLGWTPQELKRQRAMGISKMGDVEL